MSSAGISRRKFVVCSASFGGFGTACTNSATRTLLASLLAPQDQSVDYTLHIKTSPVGFKRVTSV
jgi:hypothetical protein